MHSIAPLAAVAVLASSAFLLPRPAAAPAAPVAAAPARVAEDPVGGSYEIDPTHSSLLFSIAHGGVSRVWGRFDAFKGKLEVDPAKPASSSITVEVSAQSVDTNSSDRDQHLRGPDFFNVKEYPDIVFESKKVSRTDKGFQVTGELTLLGKTQEITAEAVYGGYSESQQMGKRTGYEVRFSFNRSDFGMDYMVGPMLGDDVDVVFCIEAVKK